MLKHGLRHPVANDATLAIMKSYRPFGVRGWPALVLIAPDGTYAGTVPGEGNYDALHAAIGKLVKAHDKDLNREVIKFKLEVEKDSALSFPGKIFATDERLFISDTNHQRLLITTHTGDVLEAIGSGKKGRVDGGYEKAEFNQPMGLVLVDGKLYIADTENHVIRRVDLVARKVETIAGNGEQKYTKGGEPLATPLNSPWDVLLHERQLYIANAGSHQVFALDFEKKWLAPFAGDGYERLLDGHRAKASFNQPSGLAIMNGSLYIADSEISGVRRVSLGNGKVTTIVGTGLFDFGDVDGVGDAARLQHVLHVVAHEGKLYVADAYNHKIKVIDPGLREVTTFVGDGKAGLVDGKSARFNEPSGLSIAGGKLFVADQNNHAIRVVDLKTREVSTLTISGTK